MKKTFGVILATLTCCTLVAAVCAACDKVEEDGENVHYKVSAKNIGGMPLPDVKLGAYLNGTLKGSVTTDKDGNATFKLPSAQYEVRAEEFPVGYTKTDATYTTDLTGEKQVSVFLSSSVIDPVEHPMPSDHVYTTGSVMYDFTVENFSGTQYTLSALLAEKKAVVLNFWGTDCTWCVREMPAMQAAYTNYQDKLEILAIDSYMGCIDTDAEISSFLTENSLTFPAMSDRAYGISKRFVISGYPTTVIIDRYGVVARIESGAILQESIWNNLFETYTSDDYSQGNLGGNDTPGGDENLPDKPDVDETDPALIKDALNGSATGDFRHDENEYNWTWLVGEENGEKYIYPSNKGHHNSYAIVYTDVTLKAGEGISVQFKISSEESADYLHIFTNGARSYSVSGVDDTWHTVYPFIADRTGTYEIAFAYLKDSDDENADDTVKDTVFLKNLNIVSPEEIAAFKDQDISADIFRNAAEDLNETTGKYEHYITPVYNEDDGYYHVNSKTGPLLLANMMTSSHWSYYSVYQYASNGYCGYYADDIIEYCSYANNSAIRGYCTVDWKLASLLKWMCLNIGNEDGKRPYGEEWLEVCVYYDHYGTGDGVVNRENDPIRGLNAHAAIPAEANKDNLVTVNRIIMPRGIYYSFVPEVSGAYTVRPVDIRKPSEIAPGDELSVLFWLLDGDGNSLTLSGNYELYPKDDEMLAYYFEAGQTYYIQTAFFSAETLGSYAFRIELLDEPYFWKEAAEYAYSFDLETGKIIQPGVEYLLDENGYYRVKRGDGLGSYLFIDFDRPTQLSGFSLRHIFTTMMQEDYDKDGDTTNFRIRKFKRDKNGNYVTIDEVDDLGRALFTDFSGNYYYLQDGVYYRRGDNAPLTEAEVEELSLQRATTVAYQTNADGSYVYDDYTDIIEEYLAASEANGFVIADERIVAVLAQLIDVDDFAFVGIENAWLRCAYYYDYFAPLDEEPETWRAEPPRNLPKPEN